MIPLLLSLGTPAWSVLGPPEETTVSAGLTWKATYVRESATLFPLSSVVQEVDSNTAMVRLVRSGPKDSPSHQYAPVLPLSYLPDRSALFMKSSLWVDEERRVNGAWSLKMVNLDGSTTTSAECDGGRTQIRNEMAPSKPGLETMVDETVEAGDRMPEDALQLVGYRPGRFQGLQGDAGCPMTALYQFREFPQSTTTIVADVALKNLLSRSVEYSTGTITTKVTSTFAEEGIKYWPSQVVETRIDRDGSVARVTTHSILRLSVSEPSVEVASNVTSGPATGP